ncbi:hypothetical protein CNMCM5793_000585 [Aspergillus hiratsukae]|uniref:Uncharacterized protein n=1 Tax=Aspergillus hiratsukae TaxID=1194566 RepID=A0A8H6UFB5_9EURO|nr:hypothetical protein CNMCM5793_000585 [Aspergillus hiratsukae]KAF7173313.1 hypothetical protein CNMCM6106_007421 [Aspergillus hiratsukae]
MTSLISQSTTIVETMAPEKMALETMVETMAERRTRELEEWAAGENLWDKAIQSPAEITREEKHKILGWPTWEEMQENAQKYLGESVEELFKKAITNPGALTFAECRLVRRESRPDLEEKWKAACAAVLSQEEQQAMRNMGPEKCLTVQEAHLAANREARHRARTVPPEWVKKILERDDKAWGYVIYHPRILPENLNQHAREVWEYFQEVFNEGLLYQLHHQPMRVPGSDQIKDSKIVDFVPFERNGDDDEVNQLRRDFRNRRETGSLKPGALSNVFILATEGCQASWTEAEFPWLWVIDPDWALSGPDEDGYDGRVKVAWAMLYTKFYDFISTNRFTVKDIWRDYHQMNQQFRHGPTPAWLWTELDKPVWPDC